jgi:GTPase Era involved in 16S rRNA processing
MRNVNEIYTDMIEKQKAYNIVKEEMIEALSKDIGHVLIIDMAKMKEQYVESSLKILM